MSREGRELLTKIHEMEYEGVTHKSKMLGETVTDQQKRNLESGKRIILNEMADQIQACPV
eukprot:4671167-Amphidinium_carterae.2